MRMEEVLLWESTLDWAEQHSLLFTVLMIYMTVWTSHTTHNESYCVSSRPLALCLSLFLHTYTYINNIPPPQSSGFSNLSPGGLSLSLSLSSALPPSVQVSPVPTRPDRICASKVKAFTIKHNTWLVAPMSVMQIKQKKSMSPFTQKNNWYSTSRHQFWDTFC